MTSVKVDTIRTKGAVHDGMTATLDSVQMMSSEIDPPGGAGVPRFDPDSPIIPNASDSSISEYYRRLRTKLMHEHAINPFRTLVVTSPSPREGKTITTINLAISIAMLPSTRVLVIDADLRRGSIGKLMGVESHPGLSNLLAGTATLENVILKSENLPVHFIVSGDGHPSPAELMTSPRLDELIKKLASRFDFVIFDSAPINLVTDTQLLIPKCDAVLLVARAYVTTRTGFEKAANDLQKARILGTVLNGGTKPYKYGRNRGYYYTNQDPSAEKK